MSASRPEPHEASVGTHLVETGPEAHEVPEAGILRELEVGWSDANDLQALAFGHDSFSDDVGIGAKHVAPHLMRDDDASELFTWLEPATKRHPNPEYIEEAIGDPVSDRRVWPSV